MSADCELLQILSARKYYISVLQNNDKKKYFVQMTLQYIYDVLCIQNSKFAFSSIHFLFLDFY